MYLWPYLRQVDGILSPQGEKKGVIEDDEDDIDSSDSVDVRGNELSQHMGSDSIEKFIEILQFIAINKCLPSPLILLLIRVSLK